MRALLVEREGPSGSLVMADVAPPVARTGEVVIEVAAAGVNRADVLQRKGLYPSPPGWPQWPGLECAGTVVEVGEGVTAWNLGDHVMALVGGGAYAERVACSADLVLARPPELSEVEAAAVMEAACTAWSALTLGAARRGDVVLIHGGSGGVGTFAIQLAKAMGLRVVTTARGAARAAQCVELGASDAIDYSAEDFVPLVRAIGGADVVIDVVGAAYLDRNLECLATGGRLVVIGLQKGAAAELNLATLLARRASVIGTTLRSRPHEERAGLVAEVGREVWPLLGTAIRPVVASAMPFTRANEAHAAMEAGSPFGKIVLVP